MIYKPRETKYLKKIIIIANQFRTMTLPINIEDLLNKRKVEEIHCTFEKMQFCQTIPASSSNERSLILIFQRFGQFEKAPFFIFFTESGMTILARLVHPLKA